jgi:formate-dependent nitrite reductase membrane component NrfD
MSLLALAAAEELAPLWLPSWGFPLIGAIVFFSLGYVCWSFRDVANRHAQKLQRAEQAHGTDQH